LLGGFRYHSSIGQGKLRGFPWDKLFQLGNIFGFV